MCVCIHGIVYIHCGPTYHRRSGAALRDRRVPVSYRVVVVVVVVDYMRSRTICVLTCTPATHARVMSGLRPDALGLENSKITFRVTRGVPFPLSTATDPDAPGTLV